MPQKLTTDATDCTDQYNRSKMGYRRPQRERRKASMIDLRLPLFSSMKILSVVKSLEDIFAFFVLLVAK